MFAPEQSGTGLGTGVFEDDHGSRFGGAVMATDPALVRQIAAVIATETGGDVSVRGRLIVNGLTAQTYKIDEATLEDGQLLAANWPGSTP